jgi:hypothetical protein
MSKSSLRTRIHYDQGIRLAGSSLWFDAERKRPLCVVTSLIDALPKIHSRIVASHTLAESLARAGYAGRVLPLPFDRWVGIGGQNLRFIDAGVNYGFAAALTEHQDSLVLVAGLLRRKPLVWPRVQHLVATVPALQHGGQTLAQVVDSLCLLALDKPLDLQIDSIDAAEAIYLQLVDRGLSVRLKGLLRKLIALPCYSKPQIKVQLTGAPRSPHTRLVHVDLGLNRRVNADVVLPLHWYATSKELREAIKNTGALHVSLASVPTGLQAPVRAEFSDLADVQFVYPAKQLSFL